MKSLKNIWLNHKNIYLSCFIFIEKKYSFANFGMKRGHQSLLTVFLPFMLPENADDREPESLLDEVEFAEHEIDVEEDQHVAAAKLVSVLGNKSQMKNR